MTTQNQPKILVNRSQIAMNRPSSMDSPLVNSASSTKPLLRLQSKKDTPERAPMRADSAIFTIKPNPILIRKDTKSSDIENPINSVNSISPNAKVGHLHSAFSSVEDKNRRKCGCCPSSKRGKFVCWSTVILFLISLGVLLYFFIPRSPDFKVVALTINNTTGRPAFRTINNDPLDSSNVTVQLDLLLTINLTHSNYYNIKVDQLALSAFLVANISLLRGSGAPGASQIDFRSESEIASDARRIVGFGQSKNLLFPRNTVNQFQVPMLLSYTPRPETGGLTGDIIFAEVYQACALDGVSPRRNMTIESETTTNVNIITSLGFRPVYKDKVQISCPFNVDQINQILSSFNLPKIGGAKR